MRGAGSVRDVARASGFLAVLGVLLFTGLGVWQLVAGDAPKAPRASWVVPAGTADEVIIAAGTVVWGSGEALVPEDVRCSITTRNGEHPVPTQDRPEPHDVVSVRGHGEMVALAEVDNLPEGTMSCSGGGLEEFAQGERRSGPSGQVVGAGFLVFAGVAALWAVVTLRVTGRRGR